MNLNVHFPEIISNPIKEIGVEVNVKKTKYMFKSRHRNGGQNNNINVVQVYNLFVARNGTKSILFPVTGFSYGQMMSESYETSEEERLLMQRT
jgi:hypothetical protein